MAGPRRHDQSGLPYFGSCGDIEPRAKYVRCASDQQPLLSCAGSILRPNSGEKSALLQVNRLIMPTCVELCAPHLVHALVLGTVEGHGRSKPNVKIVQTFEGFHEFFSVELGPLRCNAAINTLAST